MLDDTVDTRTGAIAAIVGNHEDSGLIIMSAKGDTSDIKIPSVFIERVNPLSLSFSSSIGEYNA